MSAPSERFSTHAELIGRENANFVITAVPPEAGRFEQLWAKKVGENQFAICCVPFFLYDVALGAQVEWSSPSLLANDVDGTAAQAVADLLHGYERQERLVYETGKTIGTAVALIDSLT